MKGLFSEFKHDLPASMVVFFVALPLCLGIALASGAPLFSGIIAGVIGGVVVGALSGSALGVSGPAAGLAVIVTTSMSSLNGSYEAFLVAVVLAGIIQVFLGVAKAGFIAYFFPSSVIKGMLTGIGILIILKQIPHALGWDKDIEGDFAFAQADGENTVTEILKAVEYLTPGALIISCLSLAILILWDRVLSKKGKLFLFFQGPLVVVVTGISLNYFFQDQEHGMVLQADQLVRIPVPQDIPDFLAQFTLPDFSVLINPEVYRIAVVLAVVASLETLLCVEASDKLDPHKRVTPTNQELRAQGIGNIVSGLIGGLPITQVVVRTSANVSFGARTKLSTMLHGALLFLSAIAVSRFLNMIPLASLAAILLVVGYKLAKPSLFVQAYKLGWEQFIPFTATVVAMLLTDLLVGITIGVLVGIFYTLRHSYRNAYHMKDIQTTEHGQLVHHLVLAEEVSFFNKASVKEILDSIPSNSRVIIDCSNSKSIAYDVVELIKDYETNAKRKNIVVEKIKFIEPLTGQVSY